MKNFNRILALLTAVLMLCGMTTAFAEAELDVPQDIDVQQDADVLDPDVDVPELDISLEAFGGADDLSPVEEEPEVATVVSNDGGETPTIIEASFTMKVGEQKKVHDHVRTYYTLIITDTSSDPNVARISKGGIITAVTAGECIITVTAVNRDPDRPTRVWKYYVTVVGGPVLSETEKTLYTTETFQLKVSNLGKRSVKSWSSSDAKVATVDNGKVTAVGEGQCVISAELSNGGFLRCKVKVQGGAGLSSNEIKLKLRKMTTVKVKDRLLRKITWSSSDPSIVRIVSKGDICLIIARKKGECTITAKLKGGKTYSCKVIVQ